MDICKNIAPIAVTGCSIASFKTLRLAGALAGSALLLSACYVMPVGTDSNGQQQYVYSTVPVLPGQRISNVPTVTPAGPAPAVLTVRLYPSNDLPIKPAC